MFQYGLAFNGMEFNGSANQEYGPGMNRQFVLELWKQLKKDGAISNGFVDFPAIDCQLS